MSELMTQEAKAPTEATQLPQDPQVKTQEEQSPDLMSPKFAALARKEKAMRQRMKDLENRELTLKHRESEIEQAKSWKTRLAQDPYSVMLEAGLTADQVASLMLNQPNPEDQKYSLLEQQIKALKNETEQAKSQFTEMEKRQYAEAVKQIRNDVNSLVASDESYETIKSMNAADHVVELIERTYHEKGTLLSIEEAAKEVESFLEEQVLGFTKLKKIQAKINQPPVTQEAQKINTSEKSPMRTLSNASPASVPKGLTDRERRERAILAFQGKL